MQLSDVVTFVIVGVAAVILIAWIARTVSCLQRGELDGESLWMILFWVPLGWLDDAAVSSRIAGGNSVSSDGGALFARVPLLMGLMIAGYFMWTDTLTTGLILMGLYTLAHTVLSLFSREFAPLWVIPVVYFYLTFVPDFNRGPGWRMWT